VDYDIFPSKNAKTAEERTMQIKSKAVELLSSAAYLRGDVDANVWFAFHSELALIYETG
jgi:hypothetical protein